jgi:hypothetical protein
MRGFGRGVDAVETIKQLPSGEGNHFLFALSLQMA